MYNGIISVYSFEVVDPFTFRYKPIDTSPRTIRIIPSIRKMKIRPAHILRLWRDFTEGNFPRMYGLVKPGYG